MEGSRKREGDKRRERALPSALESRLSYHALYKVGVVERTMGKEGRKEWKDRGREKRTNGWRGRCQVC